MAGPGNNYLDGGANNDTIYGSYDHDTIQGGDGNDRIIGGVGDGSLSGGNGDDTFVLEGSAGWDTFNGGTGTNDRIEVANVPSYYDFTAIQIATISNVEAIENKDYRDAHIYGRGTLDLTGVKLINIKEFRGSTQDDVLTAAPIYLYPSDVVPASGMRLLGYGGNDTLNGSNYADTLEGGDGADRVFGRIGDDTLSRRCWD